MMDFAFFHFRPITWSGSVFFL